MVLARSLQGQLRGSDLVNCGRGVFARRLLHACSGVGVGRTTGHPVGSRPPVGTGQEVSNLNRGDWLLLRLRAPRLYDAHRQSLPPAGLNFFSLDHRRARTLTGAPRNRNSTATTRSRTHKEPGLSPALDFPLDRPNASSGGAPASAGCGCEPRAAWRGCASAW